MARIAGRSITVPFVSLLLSTTAFSILSAFQPTERQHKRFQWPLLALFTIGEAISVGCITSLYKFNTVTSAMGVTALSALVISLYTIKQKDSRYDLSQWGAGLSS
jgi:FtsH-binding integral membrane protein